MSTRRVRQVFHDSALTVVAVEFVDSGHTRTRAGCRSYGRLEPVALVVCGRDGVYAVDMEAQPLDVDQLVRDLPELAVHVARGSEHDGRAGERGGVD